LIRSTNAAKAVLFPLPVGPVKTIKPFPRAASEATTGGNANASRTGIWAAWKRNAKRVPAIVR